jgi:N-acetylmuramoyl-L-alanine amidase
MINKEIALVVGHTPHAGAEGEWEWNKVCANAMKAELEAMGAKVYLHMHTIKSYGARQDEMARCVKRELPDCKAVIELHYNAYDEEQANGHEFLYNATPALSEALQKRFSEAYPWSVARSGGVKQRSSGDGAGFLIKAPAASCITEPFFVTNGKEEEFFRAREERVASIYVQGLCDYLGFSAVEPTPPPKKPQLSTEQRLDRLEKEVGLV